MSNQWKSGNYMGSGLSKAQYTAKQSKPKVAAKSSSSNSYSGLSWSDAAAKAKSQGVSTATGSAFDLAMNKQYNPENYQRLSALQTPQGIAQANADWQKATAGKTVTKGGTYTVKPTVNTTQRTTAAPALSGTSISQNNGLGTSNAGWRGALKTGLNVVKNASPIFGAAAGYANALGFDLTNALGIPKAQASVYDQLAGSPLTDTQPSGTGVGDQQFFNDYVPKDTSGNVYDAYTPAGGKDIQTQQNNPINTQSDFITNPTSNIFNGGGISNNKPTRGRNPSPVSSPTTPTSDISNIVKAMIEYGQPDNTPTQQNPGTVQRPVGMGQFSKGQYANGAGNYNLGGGGVIGGQGQGFGTDNQDILGMIASGAKGLLGGTAQAEGFNMESPYQQQNNYTSSPEYKSLMQNLYPNGDYSQGNPTPKVQNSGGGGVSQQFAQGSPSQMQQGFDNSGYKSAQKSQKKALDELIKSIKGQYATSTTEGTTALEKSKQEDLLKLSGLFNFANQDPNSEQRLQYEQRSRNDYAGQLQSFLAKLAQGQSKDISGANQGYQSSVADLMSQQSTAQSAYENQQWDRQYKMAQLNKPSSGGSNSAGSQTWVGNNANGEPVFYNSKTGQYTTQSGLSRTVEDPVVAYMKSQQGGGQQGGTWEIDPQTGEKVWVTN